MAPNGSLRVSVGTGRGELQRGTSALLGVRRGEAAGPLFVQAAGSEKLLLAKKGLR